MERYVAALALLLMALPVAAGEVPFGGAQSVIGSAQTPETVLAVDLDGDGDLDALSASRGDDKVAWYENTDGAGSFGPEQVISSTSSAARSVAVGDLDGDGDLDVLAASSSDDALVWFGNTDGAGTFGAGQAIATLDGASDLAAFDLDGDGDLDVVAAGRGGQGGISWYANTDGAGSFGAEQEITTLTATATSVAVADLDGDGDFDVLSSSEADDTIAWYENTDGAGSFGSQQVISAVAVLAQEVAAFDLDGDGDLDVLSASDDDDKVAWYENTDGAGTFGSEQVISTLADGARAVVAVDLDADGDLDVLSASRFDDTVAWYENLDGSAGSWTERSITGLATGAEDVSLGDLDGDGDLDVLAAVTGSDEIAWYPNESLHRSARFPSRNDVPTGGDASRSMAAADFDGDGDVDLAVAMLNSDRIDWYENTDGAGSFGAPQSVEASALSTEHIRAVDLDRDGDVDLLETSAPSNRVAWYENDGTDPPGWSQNVIDGSAAGGLLRIEAFDVDGDGDLDVVAGDEVGQPTWYENQGAESFGPAQTIVTSTGKIGEGVDFGDLDRDGDLDLVLTRDVASGNDSIDWYENTGGSFAAPQSIRVAGSMSPESVDLADVDGDGDLDVVVCTSGGQESITWQENDGDPGSGDWTQRLITGRYEGVDLIRCRRVHAEDLDADGDLDVVAWGNAGQTLALENVAGDGSAWAVREIWMAGGDEAALADLDGDGRLDLVGVRDGAEMVTWLPDGGGQFALATRGLAPSGVVESDTKEVLRFELSHRGRSADGDLELASVELRFEDEFGAPLQLAGSELVQSAEIWLDADADARLSPGDVQVATASVVTGADGLLSLAIPDGLADAQVAAEASRFYLVVAQLAVDAFDHVPNRFQVFHVTTSSTSAEDRDRDIALVLETTDDTGSGVIEALDDAADADADGLTNGLEAATLGTDPLDPDTDGDGLSDGDEQNTHTSDPADADSDDDGWLDGAEISLGTDPNLGGDVPSAPAGASFAAPVDTGAVLDRPSSVQTVDLDRDGDLDLVTSSLGDDTISWHANTAGDASAFTSTVLSATADGAWFAEPVDFDGDGAPDVAAVSGLDDGVSWFESDGQPSPAFTEHVLLEDPDGPGPGEGATDDVRQVRSGDLDGDADMDLVTVSIADDRVTWLRNLGPKFVRIVISEVQEGAVSLALGDLDHDGDLDVVSCGFDAGELLWHENDAGTFADHPLGFLDHCHWVEAADLDRDGDVDLLAVSQGDGRVVWYENAGDASSFVAHTFAVLDTPASIEVSDLDLDGDPDVVVALGTSTDAVVWLENLSGDASLWSAPRVLSPGGALDGPRHAHAADLDGDGDPDVAVASENDDTLAWIENETLHRSALFDAAKQTILVGVIGAKPAVGDLDGDGDLDLLANANPPNAPVVWWENVAGDGSSWSSHTIDASITLAARLAVADVDGDGDLDAVLGSDGPSPARSWYENLVGDASSWSAAHPIDGDEGAGFLVPGDLDGDGDLDLLANSGDNEVEWYENDDGDGLTWTERQIDTGQGTPGGATLGDIDGDGDLDVVWNHRPSASHDSAWYENVNGNGETWTERLISVAGGVVSGLDLVDLDGDGDLDLVRVSTDDDTLAWDENDGTPLDGGWSTHVVASDLDNPQTLAVSDFDRDGDLDVATVSALDDTLAWFENLDGTAMSWTRHTVREDADFVAQLRAADLDGDGSDDLVYATAIEPTLAWIPNLGGQVALPTTDVAYAGMVDGQRRQMLRFDATHAGRSGDADASLTRIELLLTDDTGTPLTDPEADALLASLELRRGDADGVLVASGAPDLDAQGIHAFAPIGETLSQGSPVTYTVVATLTGAASTATPRDFEVSLQALDASEAEEPVSGTRLSIQHEGDTGTGLVRALSAAGDEDADSVVNADEATLYGTDPFDADTDDDGLGDEVEIAGPSDPLDPDTDDDGLLDGDEGPLYGTDPTDPDSDADGYCDGPLNPGGTCTSGPDDNCPAVANGSQTNSDVHVAGDACQCGDVTGDGVVSVADAQAVREHLMELAPAPFVAARCNVVGPADVGQDCGVDDVARIRRAAAGASVDIGNVCDAYRGL